MVSVESTMVTRAILPSVTFFTSASPKISTISPSRLPVWGCFTVRMGL